MDDEKIGPELLGPHSASLYRELEFYGEDVYMQWPDWTWNFGPAEFTFHYDMSLENAKRFRALTQYIIHREDELERLRDAVDTNLLDEHHRLMSAYEDLLAKTKRLRDRQWIPVDERLPEDDYPCVVLWRYAGPERWPAVAHYDGDWTGPSAAIVTHWMPLPEPPE